MPPNFGRYGILIWTSITIDCRLHWTPLSPALKLFFIFCREFKIRLRRDVELFTDDFRVENADFDPAMVVKGDVEGTSMCTAFADLSNCFFSDCRRYCFNEAINAKKNLSV